MSVSLGPYDGVLVDKAAQHATLGIRFWDAALEAPIPDGLEVNAIPAGSDYLPVPAKRSMSGVYVFHALPGLGALERPLAGRPGPPTGSLVFIITVYDTTRQFAPMAFGIAMPLAYSGLFLEADPALAGQDGRMYLFPSRTRTRREGMASVSCDLWDREANAPAAFALVSVTLGADTRFAIADDQGRALALFPWPPSNRLRLGSPPGAGQGDIYGQSWPVSVGVQYSPATLAYPLGKASGAPAFWRNMPGLKSLLGQSAALIWADAGGPPAPVLNATLVYGLELALLTTGQPFSRLLISRGTSPP